MVDQPNKDLGPCSITWGAEDGEVELNPTFGGVTFKDEVLHVEVKEDQQGEAPVDHVHIGRIVELTVPMTRSTLAKLEDVIMGSAVTSHTIKVSNKVGDATFALAKEIIIKPLAGGVPGPDKTWLHIHRCYPFSSLEWVYDNAGQRVTNVVFKAYPDDFSEWQNEMWRVGARV